MTYEPHIVTQQCHICGSSTLMCCSDCAINFSAKVYVCSKPSCRDEHQRKCYGDSARAAVIDAAQPAIDVLKNIKRFGELACVNVDLGFLMGGKKPHTKDVFQFPRYMLQEIDEIIGRATKFSATS